MLKVFLKNVFNPTTRFYFSFLDFIAVKKLNVLLNRHDHLKFSRVFKLN